MEQSGVSPLLATLYEGLNTLGTREQIILWRALGETLLEAGNSLETLISGMPHLEAAVQKIRLDEGKHRQDIGP